MQGMTFWYPISVGDEGGGGGGGGGEGGGRGGKIYSEYQRILEQQLITKK